MKPVLALFLIALVYSTTLQSQSTGNNELRNKRVLLFTKNGKGYVHDNIPSSIVAIQQLGREFSFHVDTTTNSALFTDDNLKQYDALIFSNTNNDVFDNDQEKVAFMRYIQAGGNFMGIHSASGTERNWKWFKLMLGATFWRHPPFQPYRVYVLDQKHPAVKNLPGSWDTKDECYFFKEFNAAIDVLLVSDITHVKEDGQNTKPDVFGNRYPAAWCHEFDGGRIWYTSLGHDKGDYSNPTYQAHLVEGLKWITDKAKRDYKKARATNPEVDEMKAF